MKAIPKVQHDLPIKLMRDAVYAPCCFILARRRDDGTYDARDEHNTVLVQSDRDWPGIAQAFGWDIRRAQPGVICESRHSGTDGTIDCPECNYRAEYFIEEAGEWLHENIGATASDPGYFTDEATLKPGVNPCEPSCY